MRTMELKSIKTMGENFANAIDSLAKGEKYEKTIDGALGIVTKYWNKGYCDAVKHLSIGVTRPKELSRYVHAMAKGEGIHASLLTLDKDGNTCIGLWMSKTLEDKTATPIIDAKGRETYPWIIGADGKPVKVDAIKPLNMNNVTTKVLFDLIIQNEALKAGAVPFTEDSYLNHTDAGVAIPTGKATPLKNAVKSTKKNVA